MVLLLAVTFALLHSVSAIPWPGPDATPTNKPHLLEEGWSPATTGVAGLIGKGYELFKRQGLNTCGYINGVSSRPVTCNQAGDVCATNAILGAFGCCPVTDLLDCNLATACVPYASLGYCNAACQDDPYITLCDSTGAPYCQYDIFVFPNTELTYFGCAPSQILVTVLPTYSGGSVAASFTSFGISSTFTSISIPTNPTAGSTSIPPSNSGSKTSSTVVVPPASETSSSPTSTSTSKSTNAGAIAGGVVGGLAVVGALGFGIFYLLSRRRRGDAPASNVAVGGPPPVDPKSPMTTYVGPVENAAAVTTVGGAAVSTVGGPQTEYYSPPGAVGTVSEKTTAAPNVAPMPYQSPQPQYQHMSYTPEGMPASGLSPQGQQVPPVSPPMSPAPPYVSDPNRMSNVPVHEGSMSPPMNDPSMIDGRQVWPAGPAVHEAPGSIPGQPSGHY